MNTLYYRACVVVDTTWALRYSLYLHGKEENES